MNIYTLENYNATWEVIDQTNKLIEAIFETPERTSMIDIITIKELLADLFTIVKTGPKRFDGTRDGSMLPKITSTEMLLIVQRSLVVASSMTVKHIVVDERVVHLSDTLNMTDSQTLFVEYGFQLVTSQYRGGHKHD